MVYTLFVVPILVYIYGVPVPRVNDFVFLDVRRDFLQNETFVAYVKYTTCEKWFYLSIKWMPECSHMHFFFIILRLLYVYTNLPNILTSSISLIQLHIKWRKS